MNVPSTSRFAKGPVMRFMSRTSARACPLALILATMPVMAQELELNPAVAPAVMPAIMPATEPATPLAATTEPTTEPTTMPATTQSAEAATQPVVPAPPPRPYDPNARVSFNFKDASADSVLDYLSEYLGFIIIKDGPVGGRMTMTSRQAIGASDAVDLLNSSLKPLNYTAIQTGRALRVVSRDKAKRANIPVHMGADPTQIKNSDELITQVIPLSQLDATKLRADLQALYSPEADVTSNAGSNTIIITDSSANIRRLVEIIASMDRQLASTADIKVFQLEYASATNAAKLINDLFKTDQTSQQQGGARGAFMSGFPGFSGRGGTPAGGAPAAGGADSGVRAAGKVAASADDRTNTLVVTGPTATLLVIADVVKQLDSNPSQTSTVFVYRIRNGQAQHMQDVLNTLFGTSGSSGSRTTSTNTQQTRQPFGGTSFGSSSGSSSSSSRGMSGNSSNNRSSSSNRGSTNNTSTSNRGTGSTGSGGGVALSAAARAAAGDLAGQVYVVADLDTNSLIITTNPKYLDQVKSILAEMDRSVPQVLIKVLFAEVTHTNISDIGFQMEYLNNSVDANGNPTGNRSNVGTDFGLARQTNGLNIAYVQGNFEARLHALATEGKVDVLSRPYILASDNQLASILVGQQVPFITYTQLTDTGQTNNTIQYQDIGIILNVTPHINPDGKVIMDVAPEISALVPDTTVQISDTVSAPVFSKRSAQSRVAIENGRTIVIGGLMEDKKNSIVTKVPLLGDIPWVGNLFRRTVATKSKTELLIFLTPHVAMESTALKPMSQDELDGVKILPGAVAPGVFKEHVDGMQRGATTQPSEPLNVPTTKPSKPDYDFK